MADNRFHASANRLGQTSLHWHSAVELRDEDRLLELERLLQAEGCSPAWRECWVSSGERTLPASQPARLMGRSACVQNLGRRLAGMRCELGLFTSGWGSAGSGSRRGKGHQGHPGFVAMGHACTRRGLVEAWKSKQFRRLRRRAKTADSQTQQPRAENSRSAKGLRD
jgi:hypothetical protein